MIIKKLEIYYILKVFWLNLTFWWPSHPRSRPTSSHVMTVSPSIQNFIFNSQSVKRPRTGPDGLLITLMAKESFSPAWPFERLRSTIVIPFRSLKLSMDKPRESRLMYSMPVIALLSALEFIVSDVSTVIISPFSMRTYIEADFCQEHILLLPHEDKPGCNNVDLALSYWLG